MKLKSIGFETELDVGSRSAFLNAIGRSVGDKVGVLEIDSEYYDNQVEFKSVPGIGLDSFGAFRDGVKDMLLSTPLGKPFALSPSFVGTHFHLFFEDEDGTPVSEVSRYGKSLAVHLTYLEVAKFFREWVNLVPTTNNGILEFNEYKSAFLKTPLKAELERVLTSNNVSKYFDHRHMGSVMRDQLNAKGFSYAYSNIGNDRPKYQPVIWSYARPGGKPLSFEVRLLPNAYFFLKKEEEFKAFVEKMAAEVEYLFKVSATEGIRINRISRSAIAALQSGMLSLYCATRNNLTKEDALKHIDACIAYAEEAYAFAHTDTAITEENRNYEFNGFSFSFWPADEVSDSSDAYVDVNVPSAGNQEMSASYAEFTERLGIRVGVLEANSSSDDDDDDEVDEERWVEDDDDDDDDEVQQSQEQAAASLNAYVSTNGVECTCPSCVSLRELRSSANVQQSENADTATVTAFPQADENIPF